MNRNDNPGILDIIKSVSSAFFGVQKNSNRERDFSHGNPMHFIIAGIVMTIIFLVAIFGLVKLAMKLLMA